MGILILLPYVWQPVVAAVNLNILGVTGAGLGRHITDVPLGDVCKALKMLYTGTFIYALGITLIRSSAILFYSRIFEARKSQYRYAIWISLAVNTAWFLTFGSLAIFACIPIHAVWDRPIIETSSYRCLSTLAQQLSPGITSVIIDLVVLLLPLPPLWGLQTMHRKKARLIVIFLLGYW